MKIYGCKLLIVDINFWMFFFFINLIEMFILWIVGLMRRLVFDSDMFIRMRIIYVIVEVMRINKCLICFIYVEDFCFVLIGKK